MTLAATAPPPAGCLLQSIPALADYCASSSSSSSSSDHGVWTAPPASLELVLGPCPPGQRPLTALRVVVGESEAEARSQVPSGMEPLAVVDGGASFGLAPLLAECLGLAFDAPPDAFAASPRVILLCGGRKVSTRSSARPAETKDEGKDDTDEMGGDGLPLVDASLFVRIMPGGSDSSAESDEDESVTLREVQASLPPALADGHYQVQVVTTRVIAVTDSAEGRGRSTAATRITRVALILATTANVSAAMRAREAASAVVADAHIADTDEYAGRGSRAATETGKMMAGGGSVTFGLMGAHETSMGSLGGASDQTRPDDADAMAALVQEREELLERLSRARHENAALLATNRRLQRSARLFFLEKDAAGQGTRGGNAAPSSASSSSSSAAGAAASAGAGAGSASMAVADKEQRYAELLQELQTARQRASEHSHTFSSKDAGVRSVMHSRRAQLDAVRGRLAALVDQVVRTAAHSVTGMPIPPSTASRLQAELERSREHTSARRLAVITAQRTAARLEKQLKSRDNVADGLNLIDFEQLKIENATLHEKIEDRQEELRKLRGKTVTTVQVLTHTKEKLRFVTGQSEQLSVAAAAVEAQVAAQREALARCKTARERVRGVIDRRRTARGFAHNDALAVDFECCRVESERVHTQVLDLRRRYASLNKQRTDAEAALGGIRAEADALGIASALEDAIA